jgi:hypothetical protein
MAVSTGYDTGIRAALNQKGISNDQITYNPSQGVMVNGQSFYKPEKVYQGTSYTSANNFNQAWDNYSKNQAQHQPAQQTQPYNYNPYASNSQINNNPYTSQTDQVIQQLLNYGQNQQNFNPYGTSSYQAAQAQANRSAQQSTRAAQEAYGSAGFGRSKGLGERVAGINNDATEYLMTQVLPQIEAQEQARRQQEYNNILSALTPLMGQQSRADGLVQQDFNNRITEAGLTGNYMNPEATALIDQILALKGQAETPGLANTDVKALSTQADQYRNRLSALGYDPSLFGSNVNAQTAGGNRGVATRTLAGQEIDANRAIDQRNFDYGVQRDQRSDFEADRSFDEGVRQYNTNLEYTQGRDKVKDAQWEKEFQRILQQDGVQNALAWAANSVSRMNAATSAGNLALNRDEFQYRQDQDKLDRAEKANNSKYDYKTDDNFAKGLNWINNNPDTALNEIRQNPQLYIDNFGYAGYQEMLKAAEAVAP